MVTAAENQAMNFNIILPPRVKLKSSRTDSHDGFFTIQIAFINISYVPLSYILLCGRRIINFCRESSLVIEED